MARFRSASDLEEARKAILKKRDSSKSLISICAGAGCLALGADKVIAAFKDEIKKEGLDSEVAIRETGCPGFCERGTVVTIYPEETCYLQVRPDDVPEIVTQTIIGKQVIDRLVYTDPASGESIVRESEIPFYKHQKRLILSRNAQVDPTNIEDYLAIGGYSALAKAIFEIGPDEVINIMKSSGLRGRGGAGFPTGVKWEMCRKVPSDTRYMIVNADEGDPGAFMDRAVLEGNPHSVLEGLIIGAFATGSHDGYIYVRNEYPLAVRNIGIAIQQAEEYGLLGENILGSGFDFKVKIARGAGAFVCGEETALIASLEGKLGQPKQRPPFPAVRGLWGKSTNINNVETWANVPLIITNGGEWFSAVGTDGSKGRKIFSLVGKVNNTGLVEVPMGISLRDIIFKIGGGIPNGKKFKAVQTGGPSGGCIPEEYLDTPVDYDELAKLGSIVGSGGMIVMDEDTCVVDVAKYFLNFLADESCGKCTSCREGIDQMLAVLTDITEGRGEEGDLELLEALADATRNASMCALGQTAPNPVLTTMRYFRDEYDAHIKEKRCPAGVCKALFSYYIDPAKCQACMICLKNCPSEAIIGEKGQIHVIDQEKCTKCETCFDVCPDKFGAVVKLSGEVPSPLPVEARAVVRQK